MRTEELNSFEERLLGELKAIVADQAAADGSNTVVARQPRFALAPGAPAFAVAAFAFSAGVLAISGLSGDESAAWAVERNPSGDIDVTISSPEDAEGLEQELEAYGVPAEVDFPPYGYACADGRYTPAPRHETTQILGGAGFGGGDGTYAFTVSPPDLAANETLVIEMSGGVTIPDGGEWGASLGAAVADGVVAPCDHVSAVTDPPPGIPIPEPLKDAIWLR